VCTTHPASCGVSNHPLLLGTRVASSVCR
jgi:hypothetical protein